MGKRSSRPVGPNGEVLAAGSVVVRAGNLGPEVLVIHRPKYDDWSLPKGHLEAGETSEEAAVRETLEETGLEVELVRPLANVTYPFRSRTKRVTYFVAHACGGELQPTEEADDFRWVPVGELASWPLVAPVVAHLRAVDERVGLGLDDPSTLPADR